LNIDSQNVKYVKDVNVNELTAYNKSLPYFDEKLFYILLDFCKNEKNNIFFKPDYILNNISGQNLIDGIEKFKQNIQCLRNWIIKDKKYDLIGEVSIDYLTSPRSRKLNQTKKYINFIKLFTEIEKTKEIKDKIKINFEKKFEVINGNEKILVITSNGNYGDYLDILKKSKIFEEDNINNINNDDKFPLEILKEVKSSGINFIITYVPRAYVNIKTIYSNENEMKILKEHFESLSNEVKRLTEENKSLENLSNEVKRLTEENKSFGNLSNEVKRLTKENKALNDKVCNMTEEIERLKNNK
jgi:hypothetical protein